MNGKSIDVMQEFLKGNLSNEEELQFKKLISNSSLEEESAVQQYFQWVEAEKRKSSKSPFSKNEFFSKVERKRSWINMSVWSFAVAASIAALIVFKLNTQKVKQQYSDEEIQQSYEVTRKAMIAFSIRLEKNMSTMSKGLDMSRPFEEFNQLNKASYSK